ncbi:glycosyltransferase family 2 protein [Desulfovibrio inopinatus]|uniref:glycosyltransferase family 2 protein n=1 Tax=Desulfovibrio inopinatus TaxID=102109 RepID=UPI00041AB295|nr:glycosyltransferase family 2 protein [Desulfovibrio inopinatus]
MHTLTFGIVTPSFNQGRFISKAVNSVLAQTGVSLQYIVMDGQSRDETHQVMSTYGDAVTFVSEPDTGPANAINKGFARLDVDIYGWLNADDIYYPDALTTVAAFFEAHSEVDVVYGGSNHIDEDDAIIEAYPVEDFSFDVLTERCFISQPAAFFRASTVKRFGPLNETVRGMDYEYWLRLALGGATFARIPQTLAATRLHDEAFTVKHRLAVHEEINHFTKKLLGKTPDRWLFNYAHAKVEAMGITRDRHKVFAAAVGTISVWTALRMNGRVTKAMLQTIRNWLAG